MCGIVGYVGQDDAWPIIYEGLKRLEYRGYDSAGIAVVDDTGALHFRKTVGKVSGLDAAILGSAPRGSLGLGHTRWATHGAPSHANAHPHTDCSSRVALVHNGIVENYLELKRRLTASGHVFQSETDTEAPLPSGGRRAVSGSQLRGSLPANGAHGEGFLGHHRHVAGGGRPHLRPAAGLRRGHCGRPSRGAGHCRQRSASPSAGAGAWVRNAVGGVS